MYGMANYVIVMAIFNSNKAKVMIKKKDSKTKRVKIIYTLKPKHFSKGSEISEQSFKILLKKWLAKIMLNLWLRIFGWVIMSESRLCL